MGVEAATYISQLVSTNPPSGDLVAQGDDHLRLLKQVLLTTFPNASKAFYLPTHAEKTADYSVLASDQNKIFSGNATGGAVDFALPVVGLNGGFSIIITKSDASANAVTVTPDGGDISGAAAITLSTQYAGVIVIWTGSTWIGLRFVTSVIDGDITFVGEVTFEDVVIFEQGVEFQGPLDIKETADFDDVATFKKPVVKTLTTLVDAATIAWDLSTGADFEVTITSNRTLGAFTNGTVGQEGILRVRQDGTGGWSLNLGNAVYDYWGPSVPPIARGPNDITEYDFKVVSAGSMLLTRKGGTSIGGTGKELLDLKTAAASATIDFVLTKWLQLYDRFEIEFDSLLAATDAVGLHFRTSSDGGATYDSGAGNYTWILDRLANAVVDGQVSAADTEIEMVPANPSIGLSNAAGETASGKVVLHNPASANKFMMTWEVALVPTNLNFILARFTGVGLRDAAADVDAVRIFCSSGNIASGVFRLYGCRK